jgi:hypothetical protein
MRTIVHRALAVLTIAGAIGGCGPIRLDGSPEIRGTIVATGERSLAIRHKTGQVYDIELTHETRIVNRGAQGRETLCAGQRAAVLLVAPRHFTASSVTIWGGECRSAHAQS